MDINTLNDKQKEAVLHIGGPMLVFAGAGSGKTRVLTYKIAYLIEEVGMDPENILAVTFTNKAAQEMKVRIHELVDGNIKGITIGTFHSIGAMLLRKEIHKIGWNNDFTIYDTTDAKAVVKKVIKDMNLDVKMYDPRSIYAHISSYKNNLQSPVDVRKIALNTKDQNIAEIYSTYQSSLKDNNSLDFDDLLLFPLDLFNNFPEILEKYRHKYKYVLVDEYQDTNKPQFQFIYLLTKEHNDIFVVGDDDQSIYGWRGADISNILNFKDLYKDSTIVKLEENYRSTKNILEAAWSVVSKNINRSEKKLWTQNDQGEKIKFLDGYNEKHESKRVLSDIQKIKNNLKVKNSQIAILYRTNPQSRAIEDEFRYLIAGGSDLDYEIIGGTKFYDRKEVKDILAYMRLIVNPNDQISFDRVINFPVRGIGKTSVQKIYDFANENNLINVISNLENLKIGKSQKVSINKFYKMITAFSSRSKTDRPSSIVYDLVDELDLKEYYLAQNTSESYDRWKNIEELISSILDFESSNENPTISSFLEQQSLLTDIDKWNDNENKVTLMTVHSSKGLEFDYIYVVGMEDGLFPILRTFEEEDLEEERRLFYVALTRAQKCVCLSYAQSRRRYGGEPQKSFQSRFLKEIPEHLIDLPSFDSSNNSSKFIPKNNSFNNSECNLKLRQIVKHKYFGKGKIEHIQGIGQNAKITILFFNNVRKKLIYKYANLEVVE